jgi:hypothetical protein
VACDSGRWIRYSDPFDFGGGWIETRSIRPGETLRVRTRWRPRPGLSVPILTQWIVHDGSGRTLVDHTRLLGYGFDPPSRWPAGVAREEEYELLLPEKLTPGRLRVTLILGVWEGRIVRPSLTSDPAIVAAKGRIDIGMVEVVAAPPR